MNSSIVVTIVACAALTVAVRALPIVFLAGVKLPRFASDWLGFIPCSIMVAIVVHEIFSQADKEGGLAAPVTCALVSAVVAVGTRSLFATVLGGVGCYLAWFTLF